jgi:curved DNA-binding protein CbpA
MNRDSAEEYTEQELNAIKNILDCKNDFYKLFSVTKEANSEEIIKQYRLLALKFHTDKSRVPGSEEAIKLINVAKETLCDPQKRAIYDSKLKEEKEWRESAHKQQNRNYYNYKYTVIVVEPNDGPNSNLKFILFMGFISLVLMPSIAWISLSKEPVYSLTKSMEYSLMYKTRKLGLSFYVKKDFWYKYDYEKLEKIKSDVEKDAQNLKASVNKNYSVRPFTEYVLFFTFLYGFNSLVTIRQT